MALPEEKQNLPTAPKASEVYKGGQYIPASEKASPTLGWGYDMQYKYRFADKVSAPKNKSLLKKAPRTIQREIQYYRNPEGVLKTDTAYIEHPEFTSNIMFMPKVKYRYASTNDQDRTEYNILQKRFNEAKAVSSKQQGGTMNQQQGIEQQVVQLVQAAVSGNQQANSQIEQIMQAAQQGNQEAIQIAQIIQKVIQTMKQQKGIKAALGAKLNYIYKLKGNCPEGEELVYMKQGGRVCPVCQKKAEKAKSGDKLQKKNAVSDFKEKRKQINPNDTVNTKFGPRDLNGKTKYPKYNAKKENYNFETRMRVQEKDEKSGKKVIGSACGSKMKKR